MVKRNSIEWNSLQVNINLMRYINCVHYSLNSAFSAMRSSAHRLSGGCIFNIFPRSPKSNFRKEFSTFNAESTDLRSTVTRFASRDPRGSLMRRSLLRLRVEHSQKPQTQHSHLNPLHRWMHLLLFVSCDRSTAVAASDSAI